MRTAQEAKTYLNETIALWEKEEKFNKIISLASFAERWRNKGGGPVAKMKELKKTMKSLEILIKRDERINPTDISGSLVAAQVEAQIQYSELVDKYGEPDTKRKKA